MQVSYTINGSDYSKNKMDFKKILARHGLKWKGDLKNAIWKNDAESITGIFIRDEVKNITITAILTWKGNKKSQFLIEFEKWISAFNPKKDVNAKRPKIDSKKKINEDLLIWDITHKPDTEYLIASGRPKDWIQKDNDEWKKQRKKFERELRKKYDA